MKRLSSLILTFSILFFVFLISLVFLRIPGFYKLMSIQDTLDILTPLVLLPLYFLMFRLDDKTPLDLKGLMMFVLFAAFWGAGQGMHLSANSIGNLLSKLGQKTGDVYGLTHFYDEWLSHYLWHIGIVGLSGLLIYRQWKNPFAEGKLPMFPIILGGIIYGFTYFLIIMEGNTWPVGVPFSVLATLFILIRAKKDIGKQPMTAFFLVSYGLATLLFLIWFIITGGFTPIMEVVKF